MQGLGPTPHSISPDGETCQANITTGSAFMKSCTLCCTSAICLPTFAIFVFCFFVY